MKNDDGLKHTKIEKTGDHTFRQHTADGGYYECHSTEKLSSLKHSTNIKQDNSFKGIGEKKELICDFCKKVATKLQGTWNKEFKKISFKCEACKIK